MTDVVPRFAETAAQLVENGYEPLPIHYGQKRPCAGEQWQRGKSNSGNGPHSNPSHSNTARPYLFRGDPPRSPPVCVSAPSGELSYTTTGSAATPLPSELLLALLKWLSATGIDTCEDWQAFGRKRYLIFGVTRKQVALIDGAVAEVPERAGI